MFAPNGSPSLLNGRVHWQCCYSGCTRPRHTRSNGALIRLCNLHRLRQNEHQRAYVQRRRREQNQSLSRMCVMPTGDVFVQMELDETFDVFDFGRDSDGMDDDQLVDNLQSFLGDSIASSDPPTSPLDDLMILPFGSVEEWLDYLLAPEN